MLYENMYKIEKHVSAGTAPNFGCPPICYTPAQKDKNNDGMFLVKRVLS